MGRASNEKSKQANNIITLLLPEVSLDAKMLSRSALIDDVNRLSYSQAVYYTPRAH
jgi:hypothetical protein